MLKKDYIEKLKIVELFEKQPPLEYVSPTKQKTLELSPPVPVKKPEPLPVVIEKVEEVEPIPEPP